jgi:hypothetical protein
MPMNGHGRNEEGGPPEHIVQFAAGREIFREGDAGDDMFIIKAGEVEIYRTVSGKDLRVVMLEEGDFFGEMAVLEEEPRMASARALTDCDLMRIDGSTFDQLVRHNPEIPVRMLRKLSRRLREVADGMVCVDESVQVPLRLDPASQPSSDAAPSMARLVHPKSGTEFPLPLAPEVFIGRVDPATGFQPSIELKDIDPRRSASRRHARVVRVSDTLYLREEIGVANGTFVNGHRVPTGVDVELNDGDEVRFGLVKTILRLG